MGKIIWGLSKFISLLPRSFHLWLGKLFGFLWFSVLRIRRDVILDNLKLAYPEKSEQWRISIGSQSLASMGQTLVEYLLSVSHKPTDMDKYFEFEDIHLLKEAQSRGKGVLILSMHVGNGDFGCIGLASAGLPMTLISKQFKSKWLNEAWFGLRKRLGTKFIREEKSSFEILRALKSGERVIFVLDQFMGPPSGVETTFFGRKTGTAQGLAVFHQRTGAPVFPGYIVRKPDGKMRVIVGSEIVLEEQPSQAETISFMTQKYTDRIEEIVRAYPGQWMWLHKRWKKFEVR